MISYSHIILKANPDDPFFIILKVAGVGLLLCLALALLAWFADHAGDMMRDLIEWPSSRRRERQEYEQRRLKAKKEQEKLEKVKAENIARQKAFEERQRKVAEENNARVKKRHDFEQAVWDICYYLGDGKAYSDETIKIQFKWAQEFEVFVKGERVYKRIPSMDDRVLYDEEVYREGKWETYLTTTLWDEAKAAAKKRSAEETRQRQLERQRNFSPIDDSEYF